MTNLPIDILTLEILPRLPPKTLLQFKCINKFFYNLISSKIFIDRHLLHQSISSNMNRPIMVFHGQQCLYFLDDVDSSVRHLPLPPPLKESRFPNVIGTCRGLFCLSTFSMLERNKIIRNYSIIVNPFTRKVSAIISIRYSVDVHQRKFEGFGYDSLNDDYKLVQIEYYFDRSPSRIIIKGTRVNVYSIKANSWKRVEDTTRVYPSLEGCSVLVEDHLPHWLIKNENDKKRKIISFDLHKDQWAADVALPDFEDVCIYPQGDAIISLGVLNGCLCLSVCCLKGQIDGQIDVWIMKEYGVHESWTKFFIQGSSDGRFCRPMLPTVKGAMDEILLIKRDFNCNEGLFHTNEWYNIRDKTSKKLQVKGACCKPMIMLLCFPSLVDPGFVKNFRLRNTMSHRRRRR